MFFVDYHRYTLGSVCRARVELAKVLVHGYYVEQPAPISIYKYMYKFKFKLNLIRHPQNLHNQSACIREGGGQADGRLRGPKTNREIEYVWRNLLGYVAVVDSLYQIYIWLSRAEHTDDVVVAVVWSSA